MRVDAVCMMSLGVIVCGFCTWGGGCGQRIGRVDVAPGELPEGLDLPDAAAVVEEYEPARVSVHPLSRLEGVGAARRAVVHVQVLDVYGHDVKWPGAVRVEVEPAGGAGGAGGGSVHFVDLTKGEVNARAFDSISRCYVVRVPVPGEGGGGVTVKLRWLLLDSTGREQVMEATGLLQANR